MRTGLMAASFTILFYGLGIICGGFLFLFTQSLQTTLTAGCATMTIGAIGQLLAVYLSRPKKAVKVEEARAAKLPM